jgi:hypothetical protein
MFFSVQVCMNTIDQLVKDIQQLLSGLPAKKLHRIPPNLMSKTPQQYKNLKDKKNLNINVVKKNHDNLIEWIGNHLSQEEIGRLVENSHEIRKELVEAAFTAYMRNRGQKSISTAQAQHTHVSKACAEAVAHSYLTGTVIATATLSTAAYRYYPRQAVTGRLNSTSYHGPPALYGTSPYIHGSAALLGTFIAFLGKYFSKLKLKRVPQREQAARTTAALSVCSASSST